MPMSTAPNPSLSPWQHNGQPQAIQTTFCDTSQQAPLNIYPSHNKNPARDGQYDDIYTMQQYKSITDRVSLILWKKLLRNMHYCEHAE